MKKGFTLIELSISIAILSMFAVIMFEVFISLRGIEKNEIKISNSTLYMQEALMFIEYELTTYTESVTAYDNKIEIIKSDGINKNIICVVDGKLKIMYTTLYSGSIKSNNNILNSVSTFDVIKSKNVLYIRIKMKNGENYERCIGGFKIN